MNTLAIILVVILVTLGFGAYLFLMVFYPEWVGITGKAARKTMEEHKEGSKAGEENDWTR